MKKDTIDIINSVNIQLNSTNSTHENIKVLMYNMARIKDNLENVDKQLSQNTNDKQSLGQFYTTNYDYILQNMKIPSGISTIVEPFVGKGDLLKFINLNKYTIECYDIDPQTNAKFKTIKQDTLMKPPKYNDKFILTNPPYLARNKSKKKDLFDKYNQNDLYKCFIYNLTINTCLGGIMIVPLNFWCSIRMADVKLRQKFLQKYDIILINIFEEKVFDDTSYSVCSFQFAKKTNIKSITCHIYPSKKVITMQLNELNNYTFGGEIYKLKQDKKIKVVRLTRLNKDHDGITNIIVKCIDDNIDSQISLTAVNKKDIYIDETPKLSARSYATLIIEPAITSKNIKILVSRFNAYLTKQREQYHSLFLTNYRESNTIARKRISFKLVFEIVNFILHSMNNE
jgi:hypothetical protein